MIDQLFNNLTMAMSASFGLALAASLAWGVLSILLSPCHLSSIPLIIGYISSQGQIKVKRSFYIALAFAYEQYEKTEDAVWYFNQASDIIPLIPDEQPGISKYYLNLLHGQYYETLAFLELRKGDKKKSNESFKTAEKYYSKALE